MFPSQGSTGDASVAIRRRRRIARSFLTLGMLATSAVLIDGPTPAGASHDPTAAPMINITKIGFGTDGGVFDFTIDPAVAPADGTGAFTIADAETARFEGLTAGVAYTITELTDPDSIVCDEAADAQLVGTNAVTITPTPGQIVNCTFTNPAPPGHTGTEINITKVVEGALDDERFAVTVQGATATEFTLTDRQTFTIVNPAPDADGNFTVTEVLPPPFDPSSPGSDFEFVGVSCNVTPFNFDQLPNQFVTFLIPAPRPGEAVNCTIVNRQPEGFTPIDAGIQMVKCVALTLTFTCASPEEDPGRFNLLIDGEVVAASVGSAAFTPFLEVSPGPHVVSETAAEGTDLADYTSSVECRVIIVGPFTELIAQNLSGSTVTVDVPAFASVQCVITNRPVGLPPLPGFIRIEKRVEGATTNVAFPFASDLDGDFGSGVDFTLTSGDVFETGPIATGVYSVAELVPPGWELAGVECDDGSAPDAISVTSRERVTCTFTNRRAAPPTGGDDTYDDDPGDPAFEFETPFDNSGDPGASPDDGVDVAGATGAPSGGSAGGDVTADVDVDPSSATAGAGPAVIGELPRTGVGVAGPVAVGGFLIVVGGVLRRMRRTGAV